MRKIDLSEIANQLVKEGRHKKLSGLITKTLSIASAQKDLVDAGECLRILIEMLSKRSTETQITQDTGPIGGALFAHACILYCRATDTESEARKKWFGIELLEPELHDLHRELVKLRNQVIAHFGRDTDSPAGPGIRDALVLTLTPQGETRQVTFYEERTHTRAYYTRLLHTLVPIVDRLARERFDRFGIETANEARRLAREDRRFRALFRSADFDHTRFFQRASQADLESSKAGLLHYATQATKL